MSKARALFVVNKVLPDNDYRLDYGERSSVCEVIYGLPERSRTLPVENYVHIGFEEGFHPGVFEALWQLFDYLRRNRKSLAFVHFFTTNPILFGPIVSRLARVRCAITFTGFGRVMSSTDRKYRFLRPFYQLLLGHSIRSARLVLFQNRDDLERLTGAYPRLAQKFHFVGSTTAMDVVDEKDFRSSILTVLLATRLMPEKGVEDFIRVARALRGENLQFLLAGPASRGHADLYEKVLAAEREGVIRYAGNLESPEMEQALIEAHILYFPSYYGEGLSRLMLEAGCARLCPVAYNIPSNRDLISDGRGFLVETGDLQQIIHILSSLAADREMTAANAAAYQAFILEHYGRADFTKRLDEIFREMLTGMKLS